VRVRWHLLYFSEFLIDAFSDNLLHVAERSSVRMLFLACDKHDPIPLLEVALGLLIRVPQRVLITKQKQSILAVENADRAVYRVQRIAVMFTSVPRSIELPT
jgi:hypothetical protein